MTERPRNHSAADGRDSAAYDRDAAATTRDVEAETRDELAQTRDLAALDREKELFRETSAIRRLLTAAEPADAGVEPSGGDSRERRRASSEQAAVDRAVAASDWRLIAGEILEHLDRIEGLADRGRQARTLDTLDREAAARDRQSSADDRSASWADRDQSAIERLQQRDDAGT